MPSIIRILSEQTINQIAAGEVIENPASVVKELVENSVDAGANEICIEIKEGGRQLIRITDNGCGMNGDDALLCLERHATSKIRAVEDIDLLMTMGFRGEAIPSIASISKFTLITCPRLEVATDNVQGTMVIVEGGKIIQCCPVARSPGTTIEVKVLFFNIPVRRKFQKSPVYDANEILKTVSLLALGHPHIKFELINNQQTVLSTHLPSEGGFKEQLEHRLKAVLGSSFYSGMCVVDAARSGYELKGFIGLPSQTRHNRTGQYLFINQRSITSPFISFAIREGYGTMLSSNRYPLYVLHLTIPGGDVDVNVHPQKKEVRLRQEQILKEMIVHSISQALQQKAHLPLQPDFQSSSVSYGVTEDFSANSWTFQVKEEPFVPNFFREEFIEPSLDRSLPVVNPYLASYHPSPLSPEKTGVPPQKETPPSLFDQLHEESNFRVLATIPRYILLEATMISEKEKQRFSKSGKEVSGKEALCIVDQKAAYSRIVFEQLVRQSQESSPKKIEVQSLLIPHTFETTPLESALFVENLEALNLLGIAIHQSGPSTFLIDAIPQIFGNSDLDALMIDLIHNMQEFQGNDGFQKEKEKRLALSASRAAVVYQKRLSVEEAQLLLNQLILCQTPYQCPQGKSTIAWISQEELTKFFQIKNE